MYLFVVGTGRCGSTLVNEILCRHPETGFISNLDDKLPLLNLKGRWNGPMYRRMPPRNPGMGALRYRRALLERGRVRVAPSEGWTLLDHQVIPGFSRPCRDLLAQDATPYLQRRTRQFFESRRDGQRAQVFVHHVTGWPRTGFLMRCLDDVRVIHVVRDGRAVANSWLQMGWWDGYQGPSNWFLGPLPEQDMLAWEASGRSFPVLAGLGWQVLIRSFEQARAVAPAGSWLDLRYEDLLDDPAQQVAKILEFAGLAPSPKFTAGLRRHTIEPARRTAYQRDLDPEDLAAVELAISPTLSRWGYQLESASATADAMMRG